MKAFVEMRGIRIWLLHQPINYKNSCSDKIMNQSLAEFYVPWLTTSQIASNIRKTTIPTHLHWEIYLKFDETYSNIILFRWITSFSCIRDWTTGCNGTKKPTPISKQQKQHQCQFYGLLIYNNFIINSIYWQLLN